MFPVKVETRILLNCPHCRFSSRYDTSFLEDVIHDGKEISCVACGCRFKLSVVAVYANEQSVERMPEYQGLCISCGGAKWTHSVRNHKFIPIRTTDPLLDEAKEWSKKQGYVTVSYIQRMMRIGYTRASKLVDLMIEEGFCEKDYLDGHRRMLKAQQSTTEKTKC